MVIPTYHTGSMQKEGTCLSSSRCTLLLLWLLLLLLPSKSRRYRFSTFMNLIVLLLSFILLSYLNHQVTGNCLRHSFLYNTPGGSVGACIISHQQRDKLGLKQCMFDSEEFITLKILKTNWKLCISNNKLRPTPDIYGQR